MVRLLLGIALALACVGAFLAAPTTAGRRFLPPNAAGVVVLDVSSSVKPETYYRIEQTLATIAATRAKLGLVLFSDVAYEALPPGTPADELRPLLRFFAPPTAADAASAADQLARTPWEQWFSGGTRISSGLFLAESMLRKGAVEHGEVILVSDLADDPVDVRPTADAVLSLQQHDIPLEIVALKPKPEDAEFFRNLLGDEAVFRQASLPTDAQARGKVELSGDLRWGLLALAALVIVLLTLDEWWAESLRWRRLPT